MRAKVGGEGGIRTHVPVTRQDAFEAPPLRPLRYLSWWCAWTSRSWTLHSRTLAGARTRNYINPYSAASAALVAGPAQLTSPDLFIFGSYTARYRQSQGGSHSCPDSSHRSHSFSR